MALHEHLREAKRKCLGEEAALLGQSVEQIKSFRQAHRCCRGFQARHTLNLAVPVLPDELWQPCESSTATAGHPTDDRGRTRFRLNGKPQEYH